MNNIAEHLNKYERKPMSVYDICLILSRRVNMPVGRMLGMTRGWSMNKLTHALDVSQKDIKQFKDMLYANNS